MNRRQAFARHGFHAVTGASRYSRPRKRMRVGKDYYLDPAKYRDLYLAIYDQYPGIFSLSAVLMSLGQQLTNLVEVANTVEAVGGGSKQLKLELGRRREDWFGVLQILQDIFTGNSEDPDADFQEAYRRIFVRFPQDEGKFDYEDGGSVLPPRYGLAWEVGSLMNQAWAMWHPTLWINEDGDEPWYSWIPQAIAAGWVEAFNDVQSLAGQAPGGGGPGWGAEIAQAADATSLKVTELGQKGAALIAKAYGGAGTLVAAGIGAYLLGMFIGGRRR